MLAFTRGFTVEGDNTSWLMYLKKTQTGDLLCQKLLNNSLFHPCCCYPSSWLFGKFLPLFQDTFAKPMGTCTGAFTYGATAFFSTGFIISITTGLCEQSPISSSFSTCPLQCLKNLLCILSLSWWVSRQCRSSNAATVVLLGRASKGFLLETSCQGVRSWWVLIILVILLMSWIGDAKKSLETR